MNDKKTMLFVGKIDLSRGIVHTKIMEYKLIEQENGGYSNNKMSDENTFNIIKTNNEEEAFMILKTNENIDIIFWEEKDPDSNKLMSGMDGKEFEKMVKAIPKCENIPVCIVYRKNTLNKLYSSDDPYETGYYLCR